VTPKKPAYPKFRRANVETPLRLFQLAAQAGVERAVVLGSYFVHFDRLWPKLKLAERHPYIRSRVEQEKALTSIPGLETCVLELSYIFGALPFHGWKLLWTPLALRRVLPEMCDNREGVSPVPPLPLSPSHPSGRLRAG
jgi:nucleoside-diphosphate-sugar epimerase